MLNVNGISHGWFKETENLDFTAFNLFTRINGSGKTTALQYLTGLYRNTAGGNHSIIDVAKAAQQIDVLTGESPQQDALALRYLVEPSLEKDNILKFIETRFGRKIVKTEDVRYNAIINYDKNGKLIKFIQDGTGIFSAMLLLRVISFSPLNSVLFFEEISYGLHPSLLVPVFDEFFKIAKEKKTEIFMTSQDPFVVYYFMKNKIIYDSGDWDDTNPDFSVFNFYDKVDFLTCEKVTKHNFNDCLSELMGTTFDNREDAVKFGLLFEGIRDT